MICCDFHATFLPVLHDYLFVIDQFFTILLTVLPLDDLVHEVHLASFQFGL